jgi:large conductance mechanosensitive channel
VVTSFVSDIILPIVALLPFLHRNMEEKFAVLRRGPHYVKEKGSNTLEQARNDGALVLAYGYDLQQDYSDNSYEFVELTM